MERNEIIDKLFRYIKNRTDMGGSIYQDGYRHDLLKIFRENVDFNVNLTGDQIIDAIAERDPDKFLEAKFVQISKQVNQQWDAWCF